MEKITIYTAQGGKIEKEEQEIEQVAFLVAMATGKGLDEARALALDSKKRGRRLIVAYPPLEADTSGWETLGDVPDGTLYLG